MRVNNPKEQSRFYCCLAKMHFNPKSEVGQVAFNEKEDG